MRTRCQWFYVNPNRKSTDVPPKPADTTPLTGAASLHGKPSDEPVLKLPISPREIAYNQLITESRERAQSR